MILNIGCHSCFNLGRKKNIRLLFAAVDIGWRIPYYKRYLEDRVENIKVESFVKYKVPDSQYKERYTYNFIYPNYPTPVQWVISFWFFIYALFKYDQFYFFSGETLLTRKLRAFELAVYKALNKKIIFHFVGSDIRDPEYLAWKGDHIYEFLEGKVKGEMSKEWQKSLIRDAEKYADHIFVSTPDLIQLCKKAEYFPLVLNTNKFQEEIEAAKKAAKPFFRTQKLKILHAPSSPSNKGSKIIDKVIEKLKGQFDFEYINSVDLNIDSGTIYPVSRYQLFQLYAEADIVIDQILIGWYGLQSLEALYANCKVLCYIDENLLNYLPENCPLIIADANTLEKKLTPILSDLNPIQKREAHEWIENNHSLKNIGKILLKQINK